MKRNNTILYFTLLITCFCFAQNIDFITTFEKSEGTETPTYSEVIDFYQKLASAYPEIQLQQIGMTDSGYPLHLITWNPDGSFDFEKLRNNKRILLINNGIHPGESDGIDATLLLFRDLAKKKIDLPKNTVVTTIPIYNIGGALNRNSSTRTNQNGPKAYGFRGNARNYDLNRDFIKSDTKNTKAFAEIFHLVQPDVFIDNHVSNGADYQYTLTHLFTQHNKLGGELGNYLHKELQPQLEKSLANKDQDITPYVNVWGTTPDKGWSQFLDTPRYSTGYTALWNTLGMMVETHMLKPYKPRVEGTYELIKSVIEILEKDGVTIRSLRDKAFAKQLNQKKYPVNWKVDTTKTTILNFKGYEGSFIDSDITGAKRLKYDKTKPYSRKVTYKNYFAPTKKITIPQAYIIPQGWWQVINLLKHNHIELQPLQKDTTITVEIYHIKDFKSRNKPYEGHYSHFETKVKSKIDKIAFRKGDVVVPTAQQGLRYILETLEPEAVDSFFNWNFFDTVLQQKEGFSPYVWEDKAAQLLIENSELRIEFEEKKKDSAFAINSYAQLDWIHKQSDYYEKAHLRYPIFKIPKK